MTKQDKFFEGYKPQFHFRGEGEVRDWQKDMDDIRLWMETKHMVTLPYPEQTLRGEPLADILLCWLQQYAAASNEVCFWKGEAAAEKERADKAEERIRSLEYAETFALEQTKLVLEVEAREKKLHEAIEEALSWTWNCGENNMTEVIAILRGVLVSLYPEEGEAK